MINLHYAKKEGFEIDEFEDVQVYEIPDNTVSLSNWMSKNIKQDWETVWLVTCNSKEGAEGYNEIFVSDKIFSLFLLLELLESSKLTDIFIQEYPSFEDAYDVALMMREPHELCYSEEDKNNK